MKFRKVTLFNGKRFVVPQGIQRIDTRSTHGWQVRFQGTKMFSDHSSDGSGAKESLAAATKELLRRIATMPAPVTLQRGPSRNKGSDLPPGISGPIVRSRSGSVVRTCHFSILLPRFGEAPVRKSIYIGNENTYNTDKYQVALNKAIEMRRAAEEAYRVAATRARRKAGRELKAKLRA